MDSTQEKIKHLTRGRSKFVIKLLDAVAGLRPAICYKYEDLEEGEIRLLRIMPGSGKDTLRCRMLQGTIDKLPGFNTLSYTWDESLGDETHQVLLTETIFLNHRPYLIAPNLLSALRYYRQKYAEPLWVDFICINQLNLAERGKQVSYMRQIYQSASLVLIWLGGEANDSELAMDFLQRVSEERDVAASAAYIFGTIARGDHIESWKALEHFWNRRYWRRTWIMQEQAVSKQIDMACGQRRLEWKVLYRFVDAVQDAIFSNETAYLRGMMAGRQFSLCTRVLKHLLTLRRLREQTAQGRLLNLLSALHSTHRATASDDRDKIYGILAFVKDASILVPRPDYICPVQTVFIFLVLAYIHHYKKLDILAHADPPQELAELPSWTPDWSATERRSLLNRARYQFRAAGHTVATANAALEDKVLVCEGICVDILDGLDHSISRTSGNARGCHTDNATSIYGNDEATFSAIWRSLICDAGYRSPGSLKPSPKVMGRVFAQKCIKWEHDFGVKGHPQRQSENEIHPVIVNFALWYQQNRLMHVAGRSIREWAMGNFEPGQDDDTDKKLGYYFEQWMKKWIQKRNFIRTATGYIGLAPELSSRGDKVCVLFGCSTPVILRPLADGYYQFIGECYIHGIMDGEAIEAFEREELVKQEFALR
jgi:Heterokaryon incompatibility protein (HET)